MASAWSGRPKPFDVVWCWFPQVHEPKTPGPKARPALILGVSAATEPLSLLVAFGTSKRLDKIYVTEYLVDDSKDFQRIGCRKPTKFDLARRVWLPYTDEIFSPKAEINARSPVIGRLELSDKDDRQRFKAALKASGFTPRPP